LFDLFGEKRYVDVHKVAKELPDDQKIIMDDYIDFLIKEELAFYCDERDLGNFPELSTEFIFPAHISNCILDSDGTLEYFDGEFIAQLEALCCYFVQFRFFKPPEQKLLTNILELVNESAIKSVEFIMPFSAGSVFLTFLTDWTARSKKIQAIILHSADGRECIREPDYYGAGMIYKTDQVIEDETHCGVIDLSEMTPNVLHYTESLSFNSCLNRKLAIDKDGYIKNCPSMNNNFGHIRKDSIIQIAHQREFRRIWEIRKDQVSKCRDCEHRYICTDCRAYLEDPRDIYSAPLKCGYDPYTSTWDKWDSAPPKAEIFKRYRSNSF